MKCRSVLFPFLLSWALTATAAQDRVTSPVIVLGNDYRTLFDQFDHAFAQAPPRPMTNANGEFGWMQSYLMTAYVRMFRATGDRAYLRKFCDRFETILGRRDDKLGLLDDYTSTAIPGWGASSYNRNNARWHVFIVHTGMITQGAAEFVSLIHSTPTLQEEFATSATTYRKAIEECIAGAEPYWRDGPGHGEGHYCDPGIQLLPLNQSNIMGSVLLHMHDVTSNTRYLAHVRALALFFKNRLRNVGNHYEWAYWPKETDDTTGTEDISHAAINVAFAAECANRGIVFTREDIGRFARTWLESVRRPDGSIAGTIGGTGNSTKYLPGTPGRWLALCESLDAPVCRELYHDVQRAVQGKTILFPSAGLAMANLLLYQ